MRYAPWLASVLAVSACGTDNTPVRRMPTENPQALAGTVPRPLPPQPALQPRMRTLADILAAGGSQMSKLDLKGFLPGASWESHQDSGYYRTRFMPDGKYQKHPARAWPAQHGLPWLLVCGPKGPGLCPAGCGGPDRPAPVLILVQVTRTVLRECRQ